MEFENIFKYSQELKIIIRFNRLTVKNKCQKL